VTFMNEAEWDRAVRLLVGTLLAIAGWGFASGMPGNVLMGAGFIAIATGISGWCPAYTVFGISTRKATAGYCLNCEAGHRR
jgi:Protein of unknown function (DUF2892)